MSIREVAILGENIKLDTILSRLMKEGGFNWVAPLEFKPLELVYQSGYWGVDVIAPEMPLCKHNENDSLEVNCGKKKEYIDFYLGKKFRNKFTFAFQDKMEGEEEELLTKDEHSRFIADELKRNVFIVKCHF